MHVLPFRLTSVRRCLVEFDFRYNNRAALGVNNPERAETLAAGSVGKRLTYRRPHQAWF
jgi:hypothetical protein